MYTDWSTVGGGVRCFTPYYTPLRADARIRVVRIALDPLAAAISRRLGRSAAASRHFCSRACFSSSRRQPVS